MIYCIKDTVGLTQISKKTFKEIVHPYILSTFTLTTLMLFHDTKEDILKNFSNQTLTFLKISSFMTHRRKTFG